MRWRQRLFVTLAIGAETGWLYGLGLVLAGLNGDGPGPSFAALLAAAVLAFCLVRLLAHLDLRRSWLLALFAGVAIIAIYAVCRVEYASDFRLYDLDWLRRLLTEPAGQLAGRGWIVLGVALIAGTWLRNATRALSTVTFEGVLRSFSAGFTVLLLAALLAEPSGERQAITRLLLPVFGANLVALALAHSLRVDVEGHAGGRGSWLAILIVVTIVIAGLAGVIGTLAGGDIAGAVQPAGDLLVDALVLAVYVVSLPFFYLIYGLIRLMLLVAGRSPQEFAESFDAARAQLRDALAQPPPSENGGPPEWVLLMVRVIELAAFLAVVALILAWIYSRVQRRRRFGDENRESLFSGEALRADLRGLLGIFRRRRRPAAVRRPRSAIERLYQVVSEEARRRGVVRDPALTPLEFAPELVITFESHVPLEITRLLVAHAYGRIEPRPGAVQRLEKAWGETLTGAPPRAVF